MRTQVLFALVALGLLATVPNASAWQYYGAGSYSIQGFATTCLYALTPIASQFGFVLNNFVGWVNSVPTAWTYFVIFPTSGTVTCVPFGGGFLVSFTGTGTAFGGP
ncbi:MAG TPA: hypothetical protein VGR28_06365 [Candidatus Thermoplasmatota archaeon]|jgi:hypothetical protein|nr:hypothetical protein [Candidatus Thermoplasmatota archaeon]